MLLATSSEHPIHQHLCHYCATHTKYFVPFAIMSESISLEETNKIRIANGLQPIPDPSAGGSASGEAAAEILPDEDEVAEQNFRSKMDKEARERQER